jgi:hypothetical protein
LQRLDDRQAGTVHHQRHGVTASAGPDYVQGLVADPAGPDLISEGRVEDARAPDRVTTLTRISPDLLTETPHL